MCFQDGIEDISPIFCQLFSNFFFGVAISSAVLGRALDDEDAGCRLFSIGTTPETHRMNGGAVYHWELITKWIVRIPYTSPIILWFAIGDLPMICREFVGVSGSSKSSSYGHCEAQNCGILWIPRSLMQQAPYSMQYTEARPAVRSLVFRMHPLAYAIPMAWWDMLRVKSQTATIRCEDIQLNQLCSSLEYRVFMSFHILCLSLSIVPFSMFSIVFHLCCISTNAQSWVQRLGSR